MKELTIARAHQLMQDKKITAVQLAEYYLDRIEKFDKRDPS
jgi:Asp-tRNA(Asn)/Glu-tRNA(Gln) amidotransferase A subunit family amidase